MCFNTILKGISIYVLFMLSLLSTISEKVCESHIEGKKIVDFDKNNDNYCAECILRHSKVHHYPDIYDVEDNVYTNNTSFKSAIKALKYHRNKMSNLKISKYLAKKISSSLPVLSTGWSSRENSQSENDLFSSKKLYLQYGSNSSINNSFKTFEQTLKKEKRPTLQRRSSSKIEAEYVESDKDLQYYGDGHITGYAYTLDQVGNGINNVQFQLPTTESKQIYLKSEPGISKTGSEYNYDDSYANVQHHYVLPHQNQEAPVGIEKLKEFGLKDVTDIALTTLAFLSFGMFILQVLVCIVLTKDDTSQLAMMPMEESVNGEIPDYDSVDEVRRKVRSIKPDMPHSIDLMNKLAHRALFSLYALTFSRSHTNCYYYLLCENNKIARQQKHGQQFWVPSWSLGTSWVGKRLNSLTTKSSVEYYSLLRSLSAVAIGISGSDCLSFYGDQIKNNTC